MALAAAIVGGAVVVPGPAQAWGGLVLVNQNTSAANNGKCIDANLNNWYYDPGTVQAWDCNRNPNQQWWANWGSGNTEVRTPGAPTGPAKCLDAWPNSGFPTGYKISTYSCHGGNQQQWDTTFYTGGYQLRSVRFNLCLSHNGNPFNVRNGDAWGLLPCDGASWTKWYAV
jgi:hypothetical protein